MDNATSFPGSPNTPPPNIFQPFAVMIDAPKKYPYNLYDAEAPTTTPGVAVSYKTGQAGPH